MSKVYKYEFPIWMVFQPELLDALRKLGMPAEAVRPIVESCSEKLTTMVITTSKFLEKEELDKLCEMVQEYADTVLAAVDDMVPRPEMAKTAILVVGSPKVTEERKEMRG